MDCQHCHLTRNFGLFARGWHLQIQTFPILQLNSPYTHTKHWKPGNIWISDFLAFQLFACWGCSSRNLEIQSSRIFQLSAFADDPQQNFGNPQRNIWKFPGLLSFCTWGELKFESQKLRNAEISRFPKFPCRAQGKPKIWKIWHLEPGFSCYACSE